MNPRGPYVHTSWSPKLIRWSAATAPSAAQFASPTTSGVSVENGHASSAAREIKSPVGA